MINDDKTPIEDFHNDLTPIGWSLVPIYDKRLHEQHDQLFNDNEVEIYFGHSRPETMEYKNQFRYAVNEFGERIMVMEKSGFVRGGYYEAALKDAQINIFKLNLSKFRGMFTKMFDVLEFLLN